VLAPHVVLMFFGMAIGVRALLGAAVNEKRPQRHIPWLLFSTIPGGLILGPIVQKYAFGALWTGWPVGEDLTDTKTLAFVVAWIAAWVVSRRWPRAARWAVLGAALVMLAVYLIPHSVRGSQLDWSTSGAGPAVSSTRPEAVLTSVACRG
jgi:hypothetical protein